VLFSSIAVKDPAGRRGRQRVETAVVAGGECSGEDKRSVLGKCFDAGAYPDAGKCPDAGKGSDVVKIAGTDKGGWRSK